MEEWIESHLYPFEDQEIVVACDCYSEFVTLGKYDKKQNVLYLMYLNGIEPDCHATHVMKLPKPRKKSDE